MGSTSGWEVLSFVQRTPRLKDMKSAVSVFDVAMKKFTHSFATGAGVYDVLFQGAGPGEDGTVNADRITENVAMLVGPTESEAMLSQWLYEYSSFGLFVAEPVLRIADAQQTITKKVAELIAPLAPK